MAGSLKTEAIVLRSMRYGEADRILHLYTPHRGRVERDRQGRAPLAQPVRRPARAVLPPRPRALRGPQRPADGHERGDRRRRTRGCASDGARARRRAARAPTRSGGCSTAPRPATRRSSTCSPTSSRCSTPTRRRHATRPTSSRSASSSCSPPASRRSSAAARCAASASTWPAFSGAAGGVVCGACEGSGFPLDEEAHAFMVEALGRPLAEAPTRRRARAAPGRARDPRDRRAPRPPAVAPGADAIELRPMAAPATTKWVHDFTEGSKDMRDLLGGKGANVAEMTRILGADRVPAGLHDHHRGVRRLHAPGDEFPDGLDDQVAEALGRLEEQAGKTARRRRGPAARLRALGRARVDAGHARHGPEPRPQRRVGRGPRARDRERALRVGLLPALRADVRQRRARRRRGPLRGRDRARPSPSAASSRTPTSTSTRCKELTERFKAIFARRRETSRRTRGAARPGDPRGLRLVAGRARGGLPPHQPHPRRLGHRGQRPADGVRQQGRHVGLGRRVQPRRGDRRARACPATSSSTPRARTSSPACATRSTSPSSPDVMPDAHERAHGASSRELEQHYRDMQDTEFTVEEGQLYMLQTRNAKRPPAAVGALRVRRRRRGPARHRRGAADDRGRETSTRSCTRAFDPDADVRRPRQGRRRVAGRGEGRDRLHRRRRGRRRGGRARRHPRAPVHEARRRRRHRGGQGHPHARGRQGSHAALVARGMGWPCVIGVARPAASTSSPRCFTRSATTVVEEGDLVAIDGTTGASRPTTCRSSSPRSPSSSSASSSGATSCAALGVRANADTPEDARRRGRVRRRGHRPVPHRAHVLRPSTSRRSRR